MAEKSAYQRPNNGGIQAKSLIGIPWRYALRCIDDLGLILRAEVIWSKPNGLPESVTDRVRRSHETWFHFTVRPRYYAAVDEVREAHSLATLAKPGWVRQTVGSGGQRNPGEAVGQVVSNVNSLGKLPGSVWTVPTQPLTVPAELGVDHFAAFPMEWPRRIIRGWSPPGVCTGCGEGRRPVSLKSFSGSIRNDDGAIGTAHMRETHGLAAVDRGEWGNGVVREIVGYACGCEKDYPLSPLDPAVVLDPFGGTGTTALVAHALGRHGISVDMSADYCRLAAWRCADPGQLAAALQVDKPEPVADDQMELFA